MDEPAAQMAFGKIVGEWDGDQRGESGEERRQEQSALTVFVG